MIFHHFPSWLDGRSHRFTYRHMSAVVITVVDVNRILSKRVVVRVFSRPRGGRYAPRAAGRRARARGRSRWPSGEKGKERRSYGTAGLAKPCEVNDCGSGCTHAGSTKTPPFS